MRSGWWLLPAAVLLASGGAGHVGSAADPARDPAVLSRSSGTPGSCRSPSGPEIQQYFIESNTEAAPFDRETRDLVYERAKATKGDEPFGTERDVNALGYEFLRHSLRARFADDLAPRSGWAVRTARSRMTLRCSMFRR